MSKVSRFSLLFVLVSVLSTPLFALSREGRQREPGQPPILKKIVRIVKWIVGSLGEEMGIPKP
jgi:hypothetical protein